MPTFLPAPPHPTWIFTKIMCPPSCPPARPVTEVWNNAFYFGNKWACLPACLPAGLPLTIVNGETEWNDGGRKGERRWTTANDKSWKLQNHAERGGIEDHHRLPPAYLPTCLPPAACHCLHSTWHAECCYVLLFWRILFWRLLDKENALLKWQL